MEDTTNAYYILVGKTHFKVMIRMTEKGMGLQWNGSWRRLELA